MKSIVLASVLALSAAFVYAQDKKPTPAPAPAPAAAPAKAPANPAAVQAQRANYPLDKCPISGEKLDEKAVDNVVDGRLVRTCCDKCTAKLDGKKAEIFKQIDDGVIAAQKAAYPLDKCPISGEKLGGDPKMAPVDFVSGTRLVRFCCKDCVPKFEKDPAATMTKLDGAYISAQKSKYTVDVCPVDGKKLDDKAVDALYGNKLVRVCSDNCKAELTKSPDAVLKKLAELQAAPKPAPKKT